MSMSDGFDLHQSISIQLPYSIDDILYIYMGRYWEDWNAETPSTGGSRTICLATILKVKPDL